MEVPKFVLTVTLVFSYLLSDTSVLSKRVSVGLEGGKIG